MRDIVLAGFDRLNLLDLCGPLEAFHAAIRTAGEPAPYRLTVCSADGGPVRSLSGLTLETEPLSALAGRAIDTLIVPGGPSSDPPTPPGLVAWLRDHAPEIRRVCSVCTGAFILAEAGLLAGRRTATHWMAAELLQRRYPDIRVDADPIFLRDGRIWSSAGVTAGIDLALALIEEDLGHGIAMQVAKRLVVFVKRPGTQAQFSVPLSVQSAADGAFASLHEWIADNLAADLRVEQLADRAGMSPRSFARAYAAKIGRTPARTVEAMRLEAACRALEEPARPIKRVAAECGFGDEQNLRRAFQRRFGVAPQDYRDRFSRREGVTPAVAPTAPAP